MGIRVNAFNFCSEGIVYYDLDRGRFRQEEAKMSALSTADGIGITIGRIFGEKRTDCSPR